MDLLLFTHLLERCPFYLFIHTGFTYLHSHKEPCTKTAGRGPVPFYPSPSRGHRFIFIYLFTLTLHSLEIT